MTRSFLIALALVGLVSAGTPRPAAAQQASPPAIIVVDVSRVLQESEAGKSIQKQIEAQREVYQKEIGAQEEKLRAGDQELARQRTILAPDAFAKKRQDFEKQIAAYQHDAQKRRQMLAQAERGAMDKLMATLTDVIREVASEAKAAVVIRREAALVLDKSLDLTDIVQKRLDKKLPTIKVVIPKG